MPNQPRADNRVRGFRIPDAVYLSAQRRAVERGEPLTAVVRRALEDYGRESTFVDCVCGHDFDDHDADGCSAECGCPRSGGRVLTELLGRTGRDA